MFYFVLSFQVFYIEMKIFVSFQLQNNSLLFEFSVCLVKCFLISRKTNYEELCIE